MSNAPTLCWFRLDLRLADHPALQAAAERSGPVIPVFIWAPEEEGEWAPGAAARVYLHHTLEAFMRRLGSHHSRLVLREGPTLDTLRALVRETGAGAVYWNRRYEPACIARDARVKEALREDGLEVKSYNGALLNEPHTIENKQGRPYKVFTQYYKRASADYEVARPSPEPSFSHPDAWPKSLALDELGLLPATDWAGGIREFWTFGERGAADEFDRFLDEGLADYQAGRDDPSANGTSKMSPHLHWGTVSPRQLFHRIGDVSRGRLSSSHEGYIRELYWREFSYHMLYHFPHTTNEPLMERFAAFPWRESKEDLRAWQKGRTGYPPVDAAMRQLWETGWMHNRMRMVVASFLVKHLRLHWLHGARWFWDTLVDADLASNTMGWQWAAGCGADAAPYFRVFNPILQGERFDKDGAYVKHYLPELEKLPPKYVHKPWEAPDEVRDYAGVRLGDSYPAPIVEHKAAREAALNAFDQVKR